jgi:LEA14-like dessication related protein
MSLVKKITLSTLGLLITVFLAVAGLAYGKPSLFVDWLNPEMRLSIHRVSAMSEETASIDIQIELKNKTFIPVAAKLSNFLVTMDGKKLASSSKPFAVEIRPFSNNSIKIPLELQMALLKETSANFDPNNIDSSTYELSLNYVAETFLGIRDSSSITESYKYPKLGLPKVEIGKVEIIKSTLAVQRLKIQATITNPNPNDIKITSPRYAVQIDDREGFITGSLGKELVLKKFSTTPKTIVVDIENNKILKFLGELIGNGKDLPIKLSFTGNLKNDSEMMKEAKIKMEVNGDLKALIEASKKKK